MTDRREMYPEGCFEKPVAYTAIPKWLVYMNLEIGAYVENHGRAATTPWQYTYGMGGKVDYDQMKTSVTRLATAADETWVFLAESGEFPAEEATLEVPGEPELGIPDGVLREIAVSIEAGNAVHLFWVEADEHEIHKIGLVSQSWLESQLPLDQRWW